MRPFGKTRQSGQIALPSRRAFHSFRALQRVTKAPPNIRRTLLTAAYPRQRLGRLVSQPNLDPMPILNLAAGIAQPLYFKRICVRPDRKNDLHVCLVPGDVLAIPTPNAVFCRRPCLLLPIFTIQEFFNVQRLNFNLDPWRTAHSPEVQLGHFITGSPRHGSQRKTQLRHLLSRRFSLPFFENGFGDVWLLSQAAEGSGEQENQCNENASL